MSLTRYVVILIALVLVSFSAQSQFRYKYVDDSLVCYRLSYDRTKEGAWFVRFNAWYLPSGKKLGGDQVKSLQIDTGYCEYYWDRYCKVKNFGFEIMAKTPNAVLADSKIKGTRLLTWKDGEFDIMSKPDAVAKAVTANEKAKHAVIGWGIASQRRMYYTHLGALYSIADDGSDGDQPREELPVAGGLAIMGIKMSLHGRYAVLLLAPTTDSKEHPVNIDGSTWVYRCFDLKQKKPVMAVKPTVMDKVVFSADERFVFYWDDKDTRYHYYDLEERAEIGTFHPALITNRYKENRMHYTIDDRYFYQVAGEKNEFDLRVIDLRNSTSN